MSFLHRYSFLLPPLALLLLLPATGCRTAGTDTGMAQPPIVTNVVVRAVAEDAKIIGTHVGGARITIRDVRTGRLLAEGTQMGGTGDTAKIVKEPQVRGESIYDTDKAAAFHAAIPLSQPTEVEISAQGPLGAKQATQTASTTMLLIPGQDVTGDGVILKIHGFIVEIQSPAEGEGFPPGETLHIRARMVMT